MARLKVFGSSSHWRAFQTGGDRTIIAAESQKRAAEVLGLSLYEFRQFWGVTRNQEEIETAMAQPEVIFVGYRGMVTKFEEFKKGRC